MSYLGQGLGLGREERFTATATAGQTTVTVGDDGRSISYTPNYVDVYLNGVKMVNGSDITVTSGTSIVFASALAAGDSVDVVAPGYFQPADTVSRSLGGTFLGAVNFPSGGLNVGSGQLQVDSSGRVRMSNQPAFHTTGTSYTQTNNGTSKIIPSAVAFDIGGNYSVSLGRFTAPISGVYQFGFFGLSYPHPAADVSSIQYYKNGSAFTQNMQFGGNSTNHVGIAGTVQMNLSANDYVELFMYGANGAKAYGSQWNMWGCLHG